MSRLQEMTVFVCDKTLVPQLHTTNKMRVFRKFNSRILEEARNLFLLCPATELQMVARVASSSNRRHRLRVLFVQKNVDLPFLGSMFERAQIKMVRNVLVHSEPDLPWRVLRAWEMGAQGQLIAQAEVLKDKLIVLSCALERFEVPFNEIKALKEMSPRDRNDLVVADDGSYLYWSKSDVHLDLDAVRYAADPIWREQVDRDTSLYGERFGAAVTSLRKEHQLRQSDIDGVSERQVRRIEGGAFPRAETLRRMAKAHGLALDEYLGELARRAKKQSPELTSPHRRRAGLARARP